MVVALSALAVSEFEVTGKLMSRLDVAAADGVGAAVPMAEESSVGIAGARDVRELSEGIAVEAVVTSVSGTVRVVVTLMR